MKLRFHAMPSMQFAISVELHEYDAAPPVDHLLMDRAPRIRQNDRDAVAAYLAFGRWAGSGFSLPAKISPATVEAIRLDSQTGSGIVADPIEYYPKALPIGSVPVKLTSAMSEEFSERPELSVLPTHAWNGALATVSSFAVGANSFALGAEGDGDLRAHLAIAVLFAADLDADSIDLANWEPVAGDEQRRLIALLGSVRLGISF